MLEGPDHSQFALLSDAQREMVYLALCCAKRRHRQTVADESWTDEMDAALDKWKKNATGRYGVKGQYNDKP